MHFLLVYDRAAGTLLREDQFDERSSAMAARREAERLYRDDDNIETVVFDAASPDALRRSHGRYFMSMKELALRRH